MVDVKVPAWSFSSMKTFLTCPKQYFHLRVAKDYVSAPTAATVYGSEFHKACEDYVRDEVALEPRFAHVKPVLDALRSLKGERLCEHKMALDSKLAPCAFFDKDCFVRGIADLLVVRRDKGIAYCVDYKTGKSSRYADTGQLELMSLLVFVHFPEIKEVRGKLIFVAPGEIVEGVYKREHRKKMWLDWLAKYESLTVAYEKGVWNARPSGLCKNHCPVTECVHNG